MGGITAYNEARINKLLLNDRGRPLKEFENHPGYDGICKMLGQDQTNEDIWLIFQYSLGTPLSKLLWQIKPDTQSEEKMFKIVHSRKPYDIIRDHEGRFLKIIIKKVL